MNSEVESLLKILGFEDPTVELLKMKTIASQYRKMSRIKHPDKPGGRKEDFQKLKAAYERLGEIIENTPQEDLNDKE